MNLQLKNRPGIVLIAVLVCMGVAVTIVLGIVQVSLQQRRQLRQDLQMEQTKWVMDAGVAKALTQLKAQPNYEGETVSLAPVMDKFPASRIEIVIEQNDQSTGFVNVSVAAQLGASSDLPGDPAATTKRSKNLVVKIN